MQVMHVFNEAMADRKSPSIKVSYLSESSDTLQNGKAMVVDVLINATPLKDGKGVIYGVLGIAQDISDSRCVDVDLERARVTQVCLLVYARYRFRCVCRRYDLWVYRTCLLFGPGQAHCMCDCVRKGPSTCVMHALNSSADQRCC